jgi:hypothetical protein
MRKASNREDGRGESLRPVPSFFRRKAAFAAAISALATAAFFTVFSVRTIPALRVADDGGRTLALIAIPDGTFAHHYVHTINLSPVDEYFRIEGRRLRLYELRYDTNSVGMPSDAELGFRIEGGRYVLSMDRSFDRIPLRVSIRPEHGIVANGTYYPFSRWMRPMGPLVLTGDRALDIRLRR